MAQKLPVNQRLTLPDTIYFRFPEKLSDPGPETLPENRDWTLNQTYRTMRGWLFPYIRIRLQRFTSGSGIAYTSIDL